MIHSNNTLAYVLSAGCGRRLGGVCKGRVLFDGLPLVVRQIDTMVGAGIRQVRVVVDHQAQSIQKIIDDHKSRNYWLMVDEGLSFLNVGRPDLMGGSDPDIQVSVLAVLRDAKSELAKHQTLTGVLISLVDLPLLSSSDVSELVTFASALSASAVIPMTAAEQPGHPIWLSREMLMTLDLERTGFSLRAVFRSETMPSQLRVEQMLTSRPGFFRDLDTPEDIETFQRDHHSKIVIPTRS